MLRPYGAGVLGEGGSQMFDPSIADLAKQVADPKSGAADLTTAANIVWTLVAGFWVESENVFLVS